jgi:hypothetical protein
MQHVKAAQSEVGLDARQRLRVLCDHRRQAAGGDDVTSEGQLGSQLGDQAIHQARVTVDETRLQTLDGVAPEDV